jgi:hypothetical protein
MKYVLRKIGTDRYVEYFKFGDTPVFGTLELATVYHLSGAQVMQRHYGDDLEIVRIEHTRVVKEVVL